MPIVLIELTRENIYKGKTEKGGFTKKSLAALNIEWPPYKGWIDRLEGKYIRKEKYLKFLEHSNNKSLKLFNE